MQYLYFICNGSYIVQIKNIYWHILSEQYFVQSSQTSVTLMDMSRYTPSSLVGELILRTPIKLATWWRTHLLIYKQDVYPSIVEHNSLHSVTGSYKKEEKCFQGWFLLLYSWLTLIKRKKLAKQTEPKLWTTQIHTSYHRNEDKFS